MKWLFAFLAVCFMVAPAMAGQDPYIAIVGTDCVPGTTNVFGTCLTTYDSNNLGTGNANRFYFSPKHQQFMYNELAAPFYLPAVFGTFPAVNQYTRVGAVGTEQFRSQNLAPHKEICDVTPDQLRGLPTYKTAKSNAGFYEWYIRLPKKPDGEINIVIQCGVVKPNAVGIYGWQAIELCAAETGERVDNGCSRIEVDPGVSPVIATALPKITAWAYPGVNNIAFAPFKLTAFKNPSSYTLTFDAVTGAMTNGLNSQTLDGSTNARVLLKACMDKTVITKLPVTGQVNAAGETEQDLEAGDMIYVRMDVPRQNTVDIYCSAQSVRLAGVGESPF